MGGISATRQRALDVVRAALDDTGLTWAEETPTRFTVELPGEHKRKTATTLDVGEHSIRVSAFVVRHPDENHAGMHHWMLERNARLSGIAFTVDPDGDVYLVGRLPVSCASAGEIDAVLGSVL